MKTLFAMVVLLFLAVIASFANVIVLNLAGLPGALMAGKPDRRSKARFISGSLVSAFGQSFIYLAYATFVINWTALAIKVQRVGIIAWPVAFLAIVGPLMMNLRSANSEDRESPHANPQVEALHITFIVVLIGFFVFALAPQTYRTIYSWVPYVKP